MRTVVELMRVTVRLLTDSNKPFHLLKDKEILNNVFDLYTVSTSATYLSPCNRRSAGSLSAVEKSRVRTKHVMLVLFLSSDITTVSVDLAEVDVSRTSVISYPS